MKFKKILFLILISGPLITTSCKKEKEPEPENPVVTDVADRQAIVNNYATIVFASYTDALTRTNELKTAIQTFVSNPGQTNFDACKSAYLAAREVYGLTDGFRFYGGPIDDANGKEGLMNGWPMDELFVDYVSANSSSGIINDAINYPAISKSVIEGLNEQGGEANIATGYHVIEFLLWGQDLSAITAGVRPYTDYLTTGGTANNQARRGQYLIAAAELLADHLQYTANAWAPGQNNYRKTFTTQDPNISLQLILTGMGKFCKGELFGERMTTAYGTQDQEDEHSCFSDQTHRDFQLGITGLQNIYFGRYTKIDNTVIDGKGLDELVNAKNASKNTAAVTAFTDAKTAVFNIQAPFDQEIITAAGRPRVLNAITKGNDLALKIIDVATAIGITIIL
jgi:putative iron-regulated protein